MAGSMTTVLCVDHDATVINKLTAAVQRDPDLGLAGSLMGARALASAIAARKPDVAVVNIDDPNITEDEVFEQVRLAASRMPKTRTIITTAKSDSDLQAKAVAHGAVGFVHKDAGYAVLLEVIHTVAEGHLTLLATP